jgi:hypothetical protein
MALALAAGSLILSGAPALAQTKVDMAEFICEDMTKMSLEEYVVVGSWMSGYYNAKRNNTLIDVKQLEANAKKVGETCKANPKMTVMKAIESLIAAQ